MLKGLYFPGLRPDEVWAGALLPLIESLVVYGVVEDEPEDIAAPWDLKVVAPLGADRSRFLALLREMTGREAESFRAQILAMSSRPGRDRDEATVGNLAGVLHRLGEGGAAVEREKARVERLWQARLFLRLVEVVSASELEVEQGLAVVASRQAEMLKALQGDDAEDGTDESSPAESLRRPVPRKSFRSRDRLAAWAVFYLLDSGPESLLLTDDPEAVALIHEEVERLAPGRVIALPELRIAGDLVDLGAIEDALTEMVQGKFANGNVALLSKADSPCSAHATNNVAPLTMRLLLLPWAEFRQVMVALSGLPEVSDAPVATPYVLVGVASSE